MSAKGGQGATQGSIPGSGGTNASSTAYGSLPSDGGGDRGGGSEDTTSPTRNNRLAYQHGHGFIRKTFRTPTNCHYCTELLWGLMGQGYICEGISEKHHQQYIIIVIFYHNGLSLTNVNSSLHVSDLIFIVCNCVVHERCLKMDCFDSLYSDLFACISIAATLVKVG